MSSVNDEIVREYFEENGFLVRQLRKYPVQSRQKPRAEQIEFLVFNPRFRAGDRKPGFLLFSSEVPFIERAIVVINGWLISRFSPGLLKSSMKIFRFLEQTIDKRTTLELLDGEEVEGMGKLPKILVLPGLPTVEPFRSQSIELLQSHGVDGILSFRSMLLEILDRVEINRNYQKSDVFEVIRSLKNYDLIKDSQMELFHGKYE